MNQCKEVVADFMVIMPDFEVKQLTSGHINQTFWVRNGKEEYVLQKINTTIFQQLLVIMKNVQLISTHLKQQNYPYLLIEPLTTLTGDSLSRGQWRMFPFFAETQTFEKVQSTEQAFAAARFLGIFHGYLEHIDKEAIEEAIPHFLDFESRFQQFKKSIQVADKSHLKLAEEQINWLQQQSPLLTQWQALLPKMPKRLIHADPKISNFLFAEDSSTQIKALIDWDTFMCGPLLYDFGDMVRSYTNLRGEDDPVKGNNFSYANYKALKKGFLQPLNDKLTSVEINNIDLAGQVVVYIQALRFLTDFLLGDVYYTTHYPQQNLNRAKNQINLLKEMQQTI